MTARRKPIEQVKSGPFAGYTIRTARKPGPCDRHCGAMIERGQRYVEGDGHPTRGPLGYARERVCLKCGGADD